MKKIFILAAVLFIGNISHAQTDTVINRYRQYLMATGERADIQPMLRNFNSTSGQWNDINYNDKEVSNWNVGHHLRRVRLLALEWATPGSLCYHRDDVKNQINAALDHWLQKRYKNTNWWHNEIGVPQYMRDIIILLGSDLKGDRLKQSLEVLNQAQVLRSSSGANLMWSSDLGLHYGALTNNTALMDSCAQKIINEINITTADGIQPDYSFHQHGARLQMYHYGAAFFVEGVRLAWELHNTQWAYPQNKVDILTAFVLNGWQWMARGINTVPGTIDRAASREGSLHSADLRKLLPYLCELSPKKAVAFQQVLDMQNGKGALHGYRYYPYSDFDAYHQKDFTFFIKTISSRTLATEAINMENKKGKLLNSGDAYVVKNGSEYFDLMSVWDWEKLPGVTTFKSADKIVRKPFVGSVSDGASGASVMDYVMSGKDETGKITAKKTWVCHNGMMVALIAGIQKEGINETIYTALDQCRLNGAVTVNASANTLVPGTHTLNNVQWIHHNGMLYIPLSSSPFEIKNDTVSGSWRAINGSGSDEILTEKVFMPVMLHDANNLSTGYVITTCGQKEEAQKMVDKPGWTILRNDKECQAVLFSDGTVMAAFHTPEKLMINKKESIQVDKPCVLLLNKNGKLFVTNPMHKAEVISVVWDKKTYHVTCAADGSTSGNQQPATSNQ